MNRILVVISISAENLEKIRSYPELPKQEMQFIKKWQEDEILENFFLTASKTGAVLIFKDIDEADVKAHIEILPYFPFMNKIEYYNLDKHF